MNRRIVSAAALAAALTLAQGCVPLAVTGATAGALMYEDRRTGGIFVEDENIEWKALARIRERFKDAHVNATSFNRKVLLTGEATTEDAKRRIEETVRSIESVREVVNELQVAGVSSLASRGNDTLVTSNVKARMVNNGRFSPNHVKVITEQGVVYLMGIVTPKEGEAAADIARSTSGVSRVVKVFEYLGS